MYTCGVTVQQVCTVRSKFRSGTSKTKKESLTYDNFVIKSIKFMSPVLLLLCVLLQNDT